MSARLYYPAARAILQVVFDGFGDSAADSDRFVIPVLPKALTVHRNSYRQADSWELTFEANDLPIDPQQVRSGAAEIYLFQMPGLAGDQRVVSRQFATTDSVAALQGRTTIDALQKEFSVKASRDKFTLGNKPMVAGLFDEQDLEMSGDGKWVTISGQDYTALLASKQWPPTAKHTARRIPVGKRLDHQLEAILAEADPGGVLKLFPDGVPEATLPIVGNGEVNTNKRGIPVEESTSYWDVMYKLATRYGFILFVRGLDVVLTKPKNIDLATVTPKRLAWGNNLESVRLTRHLGKERVPRIIVKGYDPVNRKPITVEFPNTGLGRKAAPILTGKVKQKVSTTEHIKAKAAGAKKAAPEAIKQEDEYQIIPAYGVSDQAVLERMAESLYHLLGRAERKLVAVTHDLRDMQESSLLDLAAGDAVEVDWVDFNREIVGNEGVPEDAKYQHLISRGFNSEVARAIAQNYTKLVAYKRPMRMHEATYEWGVEEGVRIELELQDFVTVAGAAAGGSREPPAARRLDRVRDDSGKRIGNPLIDGGGR